MVRYLPNILSLFRIVDLFIVIIFMEYGLNIYALIFFALGILSDILDGEIARRNNVVTNIGKLLDPLTDKIFVIGILVAMIHTIHIPYWIVIIIIAREFAVTGLRGVAAIENIAIPANKTGKVKTTSQFLAIGILMLNLYQLGVIMLVIAMIFTIISGSIYFLEYYKVIKK